MRKKMTAQAEIELFNPRSPAQVKKMLAKFGIKLPDTNETTLAKYKNEHPLISKILELRTVVKFKGTSIDGYRQWLDPNHLIHCDYGIFGAETGRCNSHNPNGQNVPPEARVMMTSRFEGGKLISPDCSALEYRLIGHATQDEILLKVFRDGKDIHRMAAVMLTGLIESAITDELRRENKTTNYAACLALGTKVLTSDLEWTEVDKLYVGQGLLAFDENQGTGYGRKSCRRWRPSQVISTSVAVKPCYKITFDNRDQFIASEDHRLIVKYTPQNKKTGWKEVKKLKVGNSIPKYLEVWKRKDSYLSGWLGGFFDREGNLTKSFCRISGAQKSGVVFERVKQYVKALGFKFSLGEHKESKVQTINIIGGMEKALKFLGLVQPVRLIENLLKGLLGSKSPIFQAIAYPKIVSIEYVGEQEVIVLETTTKTYIAEGYAMHNCYGCGKDQFYARLGRKDEALFRKAKGLYPGVNAYKRRMEAQINHTGIVENIFSRSRKFSGEIDYSTYLEAFNWLFQSAGHTILKCMVIEWYKQLVDNDALDCVKLAQEGHDSCILDTKPAYVNDVAQMIKNTNLNGLIERDLGVKMTVPMLIDVKILDAWK